MKARLCVYIMLCTFVTSFAQSRLPNISWPYQFDEFKDGTLHYTGEGAVSYGKFNIHLQGNILQYVNNTDGLVHKAETRGLVYVEIDSVRYIVADGRMMQEIYSRDGIELLCCHEADWDALFRYDGAAYGMSISTSAAMATHPFNLAGLDRPRYDILQAQKHDGREILAYDRYYLYYKDTLVKAAKKNIQQLFHLNSKEFKAFLKQNHTDWQSPESLKAITDYVAQSMK